VGTAGGILDGTHLPLSGRMILPDARHYGDCVSEQPRDFAGMTVNERLVVAGLLGTFDAAIDAGDRQRAVELLGHVAMSEDSAAATVDAVLANPLKYGFLALPETH
jgi:hypothetical protein